MRVNDLEIIPVLDTMGRSVPSEQYLGRTDDDWIPHRDLLDEDGLLVTVVGGFLIRGAGERLILVDAGLGGCPSKGIFEKFGLERRLLDNLAAQGARPEDITDVVFTHLHADHTGWSTKAGRVVFDHADFWCGQADWDHFIGPDEKTTKKLLPIADRIHTWATDGPFLPGFDAVVAPGHTPGSTIVVISSGAARAMLLGDVVHCPVELLELEWDGIYDLDPALARRTRERLDRELDGTDIPVAAAHFPGSQFGRLLQAEGRRRWVFD